MALTVAERKERLPYGAQKEIAEELAELDEFEGSCSKAYVSLVVAGKIRPETQKAKLRLRRAQVALARRMRASVDEAFPERMELARAS